MQQVDRPTRGQSAFALCLRTGRRPRASIERKFNPWHDPENGRFTFKNAGGYFPGGRGAVPSARTTVFGAAAASAVEASPSGGTGAQETDAARSQRENDPHNPRNHAIYVVRKGDNLTRIAAKRKGLTVADMAWLNGISAERPLRIGQRLMVPHQWFLDDGREAKNKFLALAFYMRTHGGRMPPNPANPPSLESQILDRDWRQEIRASYNYYIDSGSRFRLVFGMFTLTETPKRSRKSQREVPERGPRDDGGHYIAPRLNGPTDWFNHFAQDLHINRGVYRDMENDWYKEAAAGKKVFVNIRPFYVGASKRPSRVDVTWTIDEKRYSKTFPNEVTDEKNAKR